MNKKFIWFLLLTLIFSCQRHSDPDLAIVKGVFPGAEGKNIKFEELKPFGIVEIDSMIIDKDGRFQFQINPAQQSFYLMRFENENPISLVMDKGDTLQVTMGLDTNGVSYQVKGKKDSQILQEYYLKNRFYYSKIDSLQQVFFESRDLDTFYLVSARIDRAIEKTILDQRKFTETLIRNNLASLASILLFNQSFAGKAIFDLDQNLNLFSLIDENLNDKYPGNPHVVENHKRVFAAREKEVNRKQAEARIAIGKAVPEISLPGIDGRLIDLADLRGTNAILFFWASWSPESRADLQQLKILYKDFKAQNFEIYAVSLDNKEKFWKSAVQIEKPGWINVADINGMGGTVSQLFRIPKQLPYFFLIDKNGIIVTKTSDFSVLKDACLRLANAG